MKNTLIIIAGLVFLILVSTGSFYAGYYTSELSLIGRLGGARNVDSEKLMQMVNDWRQSEGLSAFRSDQEICDKASLRAYDIQHDNTHKGFHNRFDRLGSVMAENLSDGLSERDALREWLNSTKHRKTLSGNYIKSCIRCINGRCAQVFSN